VDEHVFYPDEDEDSYKDNLKRMQNLSEITKLDLKVLKVEEELGFSKEKCTELLEA
jgi:hypothetical protein